MIYKDLYTFKSSFSKMELNKTGTILLSGSDMNLADPILHIIKKRLAKEIGSYESIVFTAEAQEDIRFQKEISNIPIFSSYRFLLVRQADEIFKNLLRTDSTREEFANQMKNLPDQTLLMFLYSGRVPSRLLKILQEPLLHYDTRSIYPNQMSSSLQKAIQARKLTLSKEAFSFLQENVKPELGSIEQLLSKLQFANESKRKESKQEGKGNIVELEDIQNTMFPSSGWNIFTLIDSLFAGDKNQVIQEYGKFTPPSDNLFAVLKIILKHVNEIRMASIAYSQNMNNTEMLRFLGLETRPPIIQKKILQRLQSEVNRFDPPKQTQIYNFLIEMHRLFRSEVPLERQLLIFQERTLPIFFSKAS